MLSLNNITYRIAGRTLFENVNLTVPSGYKVGLVGPNGTGKSTLFNLITRELELDQGEILIASNLKIGMVRQDLPSDETPLIDIVLAADTERASLLEEAETATDPQRIADIYSRLDDIDAYDAPARASIILSGLGFDFEAQQQPISSFSGGWRMRVALAAALFRKPDLLLLDEPTNHLDFEAIIWLENYLIEYPFTFIIISHDRDILNKTVDHVIHLDQQTLTMYTGNYDQFETVRAQKMMNQQALFEKQQAQKDKMMAFVTRFGAKASKAKQAQSRLKAIQKMDMVEMLIADRAVKFNFPQPEEIGSPIISANKLEIGYTPGKPVLRNVGLSIGIADRIALLGANGNGKSTLIKLLSGTLKPMGGSLIRDPKLRVGYFAQHQEEELDVEATPYEILKRAFEISVEHNLRAMLGKFGFDKGKADTKVKDLSGGEKARLLFCMMSYHAPHIMLLDEPTNHLDMDARAALIQALNGYEGCVIIVSHDPHLVEAVADELWIVKDGTVMSYDDDLDTYKQLVIEQRKRERAGSKKDTKENKKKNKNSGKPNLKHVEKEIEVLNSEKQKLEEALASPKVINDKELMNKLLQEFKDTQDRLDKLESEWLEGQE